MNKKKSNATKPQEVKITITLPDNVNTVIRQQKINRIYDLLKPKKTTT